MSSPRIQLYTRRGCHLCQRVREQLARFGCEPELVDIDLDPRLKTRYDDCIPVVTIDGKERFRGPISDVLLGRLLSATARESSGGDSDSETTGRETEECDGGR